MKTMLILALLNLHQRDTSLQVKKPISRKIRRALSNSFQKPATAATPEDAIMRVSVMPVEKALQ